MLNVDFPKYRGRMEYVCQHCSARFPGDELQYACPACGGVLMLENVEFAKLKETDPYKWREIFDSRQQSRVTALRGIFRFYELMAPVFEPDDIIWLGEGSTPIIEAASVLQKQIGLPFAFKNEGQNPSASFKDRGMACAFSCLKWLCRMHGWDEVLTICASTGDTSAAAALYGSYVGAPLKSVVLLPQGKVTPQQLSQPLGSGAKVFELPGVFDDCMKVVEYLAEHYRVALLNSKNAWRILGQESYAYEVAQFYNYDLARACVFVPIGNAGNITAIMSGFMKMLELSIIKQLPRIFGVQSEHADPVARYYETEPDKRVWRPVTVRPSVAQAAMIGNPVSFPRVKKLAAKYVDLAGPEAFQVVRVTEQEIMDSMLQANRHGHIACTQGGECLAGLKIAVKEKLVKDGEFAVLDSTAHALKFADFQDKYFRNVLPAVYGVTPEAELRNEPQELLEPETKAKLTPVAYTEAAAQALATDLQLKRRESRRADY